MNKRPRLTPEEIWEEYDTHLKAWAEVLCPDDAVYCDSIAVGKSISVIASRRKNYCD